MIEAASTTSSDTKYIVNIEQLKSSFQVTGPGNRMNHSMGFYNEQIFIVGGTSASNSRHDQHYLNVYCYSLETRQWSKKQFPNLIKNQEKEREKEKERDKDKQKQKQKQRDKRERQRDRERDRDRDKDKDKEKEKEKEKDKDKDNQIDGDRQDSNYGSAYTRSFMACCQKENKLYLFGGSNHRNECNNDLIIFDMRKCQWEMPENLQAPQPRESAYMTAFMDNYLLLYGGIDLQKLEIYQHFYSYKIDTGVWRKIDEGNYRSILRPRYLTSLCSMKQGQKIYLFGGQFRNADGLHTFLSDFYEISVSVRKTGKSEIQGKFKNFPEEVLKVDCVLLKGLVINGDEGLQKKYPEAKSAHKLLALSDEYIVMVGGANHEYYYLSCAWVYSISNKIWRKIQFDFTIPKQAGIECCISTKMDLTKQLVVNIEKPEPAKEPKYLRELKQHTTTRRKDRKEENKDVEKENDRDKDKNGGEKVEKKYNTIFLYGGLNSYDNVRGDLFRIEFEFIYETQGQEASEQKNEKMEQPVQRKTNGKQCKQLQQLFYVEPLKKCLHCEFPREKVLISRGLVESFANMIPYPFNAIGLFLENAHNHTATEFCVAYRYEIMQLDVNLEHKKAEQQPPVKIPQKFESLRKKIEQHQQNFFLKTPAFLHISESNQIHVLSYQQLKSSLKNFEYALYFTYHNIQKKVKTGLQRQHQLHEYGAYLKAGALRLGSQFIYLSKGISGELRLFAYLLANAGDGEDADSNYYQFCSYVWDLQKKRIIEQPQKLKKVGAHHRVVSEDDISSVQYYEYSYKKINKKYEKYLADLYQSNSFEDKPNHLLIFKLKRTVKQSPEALQLFPHSDTVDICYTPYKRLLTSHSPGIYESIDLSMRAYMSCYFLKNDIMKMVIKVNNLSKPVTAQICLESFDMMAKNRCIYEIDNSIINIEVKLMQLYFNPLLSPSMISFHNGILFYHKGRLVARHGCPIGELYRRLNNKTYNYFHLFGLLEVPEAILPNVFRTEFIYNVMMEKLRARLKFIEKMLMKEFQNDENPQLIRAAGHSSNALAFQTFSQDKTVKITKKMSQSKQKKQKEKKEDVEFNPNIKY